MHIVYYTCGEQTRGSTRLRAIIPGRFLRTLGHEVIFNPRQVVHTDVAVFQKRADLSQVMRQYQQQGTCVVMDISDYGKYPSQYADVTVVGTKHLTNWYPKSSIIPDVLDVQDETNLKTTHSDVLSKIVWFGAPENISQAAPVAKACKQLGLRLHMISDHSSPYAARIPGTVQHKWSLATIDRLLIEYDLAVCPFILEGCHNFKSFRSKSYLACKSLNRPLKAWALGLPVAGSPIPSYVDCGVVHLATTVDEWVQKLDELHSRILREEDAARGASLVEPYRVDVIAQQWLNVFNCRADGK